MADPSRYEMATLLPTVSTTLYSIDELLTSYLDRETVMDATLIHALKVLAAMMISFKYNAALTS